MLYDTPPSNGTKDTNKDVTALARGRAEGIADGWAVSPTAISSHEQ